MQKVTPITAEDTTDPEGLYKQVVQMFEEWKTLCSQPNQPDNIFIAYISSLQNNLLNSEERQNKVLRICVETCIAQSRSEVTEGQMISYRSVDAFAKMVVLLFKHSDGANVQLGFLHRVLGVIVRALIKEYDEMKIAFNQKPYFRLLADLLVDLNSVDPALDHISLQILLAFSNTFMMLQPSRLPGFSFAWLELISHRMFMPKLLLSKQGKV